MYTGSIYRPLGDFLKSLPDTAVTLTFAEIEAILARTLPWTAYRERGWWDNTGRRQSHQQAWLDAGWKTRSINIRLRTISFVRASHLPC